MNNTIFIEKAVISGDGVLSKDGALMVKTGASTGRSTKERYVVRWPQLESEIDWGATNQAISPDMAESFFARLERKLSSREHFTMKGYVGCFKVSVKSLSAWHVAFAQNMFRETYVESLKAQVPEDLEISIFHDPHGDVQSLGVEFPHAKAIIVDPLQLKIGIVGTAYAGEIKKSAFSLCNYILPRYDILPMHSSANCDLQGGQSSVLFGLSGTGKTTLSADPNRYLIGDDEIIWSKSGLSNLEGGCYAKLIRLDAEKEPDIYNAANRFGSILENVVFDPETRTIDFDDDSITENTRASYPMTALKKVFDQKREAEPPRSIVFLTADAFGALPAVARLNSWQAQYHFISGYTAKVAGTELGVSEPQATFSACFGAPFMPRPASVYAKLLADLMQKHNVSVWLLNTGWTKGGYKKGERFPIPLSRQLLSAIQSGELEQAPMTTHPLFGFQVPTQVKGLDSEWLAIPEGPQVADLARRFFENAQAKKTSFSAEIIEKGGPRV